MKFVPRKIDKFAVSQIDELEEHESEARQSLVAEPAEA